MKRSILLITSMLIVKMAALAQFPGIQWQKCLGGSKWEVAFDICETSDGGYIVAGYSNSQNGDVTVNKGNYDYWIVKLNTAGDIQWQKTYGGSLDDIPTSIEEVTGGGYIVAGYSESNNGDVGSNKGGRDIWVIRLNGSGDLVWSKTFGGSEDDGARLDYPLFAEEIGAVSIKQTPDGGYILASGSESNDGDVQGNTSGMNYWILKLNSSGDIVWEKSYDEGTYCNSISNTTDGGYIAAGSGEVIKLDANGAVERRASPEVTVHHSIVQTADGGYVSAGYRYYDFPLNMFRYAVTKMDDTLGVVWVKYFSSSWSNSESIAYSVQQTDDDGFIIAGSAWFLSQDTVFHHGNRDFWILKLDMSGTLLWQRCYGGGYYDIAYAAKQTSDGAFIVAGVSDHESGDVTGWHNNDDYWILKLSPWSASVENTEVSKFFIRPNPAQGSFTVEAGSPGDQPVAILVSDILGHKITERNVSKNETLLTLDIPTGVYFVTVITKAGRFTEKLVVR